MAATEAAGVGEATPVVPGGLAGLVAQAGRKARLPVPKVDPILVDHTVYMRNYVGGPVVRTEVYGRKLGMILPAPPFC
jgi:hypothetical protein